MAGIKISGLPAIPSCALGDLIAEVQPAVGGTTYKATLSQLATLFNANLAFLPLAGGTMSGAINMGAFQINNMADPTAQQDAATKAYVDAVAQGLNILQAAYAASTTALTVTYNNGTSGVGATLTNAGAMAAFSIDSVSPPLNSRILIKNQASTFQNGVYTVTVVGSGAVNWVLTRATDYDQPAEINPGDLIIIDNGTVNAKTAWMETATVATIGTDPITFSQFGAVFPLSLANGGTGAALTASNGGIVYSNASTLAILAGTATAGLALLSGASTTPSWSTSPPFTQTNVVTFTTGTSTYTPTTGTKYISVELQGCGGGSGGAAGAGGQAAAGGGGAGGGYAKKLYTIAQLGANASVVIGAVGTAGSAGNNAGGTGTASTFTPAGAGAVLTANGGGGGGGSASSATLVTSAAGGTGGTATGGDINISGQNGTAGFSTSPTTLGMAGNGGGSFLGRGATNTVSTANSGALAGQSYGGGAAGALNYGGVNVGGAAGGAGVCVITEYISV